MKILKGLFEELSDSMMPGMANKDKVIKDQQIFRSGELVKEDKEKNKSKDVGSMKLPFEGVSVPLELPGKKNITDAIHSKAGKALDDFGLPGFDTKEMAVDPGTFLDKGLDMVADKTGISSAKELIGIGKVDKEEQLETDKADKKIDKFFDI